MKAPSFAYARPDSLREALELLARHGEAARVLAGGQSLLASLNMRLSSPELLVDITGLGELSGIRVRNGALCIGALTRHCEIERSAEVARHLPLLAQAVAHVAHVAIRNAGTLGGSLALADPAAEYPACALALDATLVIAGAGGERRVAARDFFRALYSTALGPDELLLAAEFPLSAPGYRSAFLELARRQGDYAIVGVAAHGRIVRGTISDLRLAYLGVGATAVRARRAAAALEGKAYGPQALAAAQAALGEDLDPSPDLYHTAATKLHLARVLTGRVLAALVQ
ncbi:MAG TPA: xanthine dehydrogenase family protein subunit M [Burkholderiales bacterium]|nr:xanthine dehydrogenase family protein subunit M [Burkholderiales bacterium]